MSHVSDPKKEKGEAAGLLDDIFGEEAAESTANAALADLEQLSAVEVLAETESVIQELRIRQGE